MTAQQFRYFFALLLLVASVKMMAQGGSAWKGKEY